MVPNPKPTSYLPNISRWVGQCLSNAHSRCCAYRANPGRKRLKPTRLLRLGALQPEIVRLVQVDDSKEYAYVTLSHRWGIPEPPKLTSSPGSVIDGSRLIPMSTLEKGVLISSLPKTFRDAIEVVQFIRLKHIWIDSLCILQDLKADSSNPDVSGFLISEILHKLVFAALEQVWIVQREAQHLCESLKVVTDNRCSGRKRPRR